MIGRIITFNKNKNWDTRTSLKPCGTPYLLLICKNQIAIEGLKSNPLFLYKGGLTRTRSASWSYTWGTTPWTVIIMDDRIPHQEDRDLKHGQQDTPSHTRWLLQFRGMMNDPDGHRQLHQQQVEARWTSHSTTDSWCGLDMTTNPTRR